MMNEIKNEETKTDAVLKKWYIINTYTGYEEKIKNYINKLSASEGVAEKIGEILIPKQEIVALRKGKKKILEKEFFPGYILINMEFDKATYWFIKNINGVTDFLGGEKAIPLLEAELKKILDMIRNKEESDAKPEISFKEGDRVRIMDGPFDNFMGSVETADESKQKVKVMVTIFGRTTPVELDFLQVEKI